MKVLAEGMHRDGPPRRQRSGSRDRGRRDDRECRSDGRGSHYEDRGGRRPDARDRMPDRGQRDDRRDSGGWAWGPRSGTDDGRGYGGSPRPTDGRQVESQTRYYDSQAFQHQSRPEAMGVRDSGVRRVESPRRHAEPMSVPDLVSDGPVLVSDWMNGCLDVPIGRCESA